MSSLLSYPKFKAVDVAGVPYSGGKLYTYINGTTTAKATYSDVGCATPNANPVVLDSNGEATVYLKGRYKLVLKTSADAVVWTLDNVQGMGEWDGKYYADYAETDQGVTGAGVSLKALVDVISANQGTIVLPHNSGGATTTYTLSTNLTVPANVSLKFERGARLTIDSGKTLTMNGLVEAEAYQIFAGAGTATVNTYPQSKAWAGTSLTGDFDTSHNTDGSHKNGIGTTDSPTFATVKLTGLTDTYVPKHTNDATGLTNSPISISGNNVGIGEATPAQTLVVNGNGDGNSGITVRSGYGQRTFYFGSDGGLTFNNGSNVGVLNSSGAWIDGSDRSFKKHIRDLKEYGLKTVLKMKPRKYQMRKTSIPQIGFIAQELEEIVPEVVSGQKGGRGIAYGHLTAILVKAIQEQQAQIEKMRKEINYLKRGQK